MAANGIVREVLGDLDARLDHWRQTQQAGKIPRIGMLMPGTPWLIGKFLYCLRGLLF